MVADDIEPGGSLRSRAISEIRSRIQRRELAPDEMFPEVAMCEALGMSRAPVREALILLAAGGWVEALPRAGWQVRPMTLNEARDLLAVRSALLPPAAAAAARRVAREPEAAAALRDFADHRRHDVADDAGTIATYRSLRRIVRLSGNLEYDRCLEDVLARLVRYYLLDPVLEVSQATPPSLGALVSAVLAGDVEVARAHAVEYVSDDQAQLTEAIIDSDLIRSVKISAGAVRPDAVRSSVG